MSSQPEQAKSSLGGGVGLSPPVFYNAASLLIYKALVSHNASLNFSPPPTPPPCCAQDRARLDRQARSPSRGPAARGLSELGGGEGECLLTPELADEEGHISPAGRKEEGNVRPTAVAPNQSPK